jgi:hypothetical protein
MGYMKKKLLQQLCEEWFGREITIREFPAATLQCMYCGEQYREKGTIDHTDRCPVRRFKAIKELNVK